MSATRIQVVRNARVMRAALLVFLALAAAGCSPRRVAEGLLLGSQFVRTANLAYGEQDRQRLDVYRPRTVRQGAPVVVFLYGGRWQSGSKDEYRLLGDALTRRGMVAVIPEYRLYPQVRFPAWVQDAALAVRWARDNAARYGGDPDNLVVVGHSAGAHTAALLALDERWLREAGVPAGAVRGFAALAGPVDTVWTDADVQALMGPAEGWPATYPATHVDGVEPPLLLLHGSGDRTVSPQSSARLAARIRERGGCARAILYPGVGHVQIIVAAAVPGTSSAPVLGDLTTFVRDPRAMACRGESAR
ncbi:alpha/beta hydrolase [Longimicrobium sp.]|uniref:alpha/beta hydrolase n=1 Tax=Longimicrobium sp. TaxID=2029185 RepID=UPI003B3B2E54